MYVIVFWLAKVRIRTEKLSRPENKKKKKGSMIANQERMRLSWILSHKDHINVVLCCCSASYDINVVLCCCSASYDINVALCCCSTSCYINVVLCCCSASCDINVVLCCCSASYDINVFLCCCSASYDINVVLYCCSASCGINVVLCCCSASCVDAAATEMSTVVTIFNRCLKIKEQLRLKYIVCVFDQAIYSKAMELKWR